MRLLIGALFSLLVAAAIGLGSTWFALTRNVAFGAMSIGSWTAYPQSGSAEIDPYARASIARTGELPMGLGDGVSFIAKTRRRRASARRALRRDGERHDPAGALFHADALRPSTDG